MAAIAALLMLALSVLAFRFAFGYRSRRMDEDVKDLF